jgi:hypothetical protein
MLIAFPTNQSSFGLDCNQFVRCLICSVLVVSYLSCFCVLAETKIRHVAGQESKAIQWRLVCRILVSIVQTKFLQPELFRLTLYIVWCLLHVF